MSAVNDNYALLDNYIQAHPYTENSFRMNNATKNYKANIIINISKWKL